MPSLLFYGLPITTIFPTLTTAAAEAQGLDEAGKTVSYDQMQPGDLIFYSFTSNGRYKNISHVAVYVGDGKVVEALNENSGVVYRDVASVGKIVENQITRLHLVIGYGLSCFIKSLCFCRCCGCSSVADIHSCVFPRIVCK